jgi:glycerophosphoryl diester phosphodiesterase
MPGALDGLFAPAPDEARVEWLRKAEYAHRGVHGGDVVENSPTAFAGAIARGMGIECDVQETRDGRAMVFHDWELDRLTGERGPVAAREAQEIERIPLGKGSDTIPTLERLLAEVAGRVPLLIEVKANRDRSPLTLCRAVCRALDDYRGDVAVMSFDPRVPNWFSNHAPSTARGLVMTENGKGEALGPLKRRLALWHAKPDFLAYDIRDLPSRFAAAQRARGLPVLTWTVRTPELRARAARYADAPIVEAKGLS